MATSLRNNAAQHLKQASELLMELHQRLGERETQAPPIQKVAESSPPKALSLSLKELKEVAHAG